MIHCEINVKLVFHEILWKKNFTVYPSLYISCANEVEMWVLKEKKSSFFLNRVIESYSSPIKVK